MVGELNTFAKLRAFVKLTRPIFLLGGALLHGLGIVIAASQGVPIHVGRLLLGQWLVTAIQLTAHYSNEYYDVEVDRLVTRQRTLFSGGSGVLASGELSPQTALIAARLCALNALVIIAITLTVEPVVGVIGIVALLGSWFYSWPPLSLMGSGWGELTTSLIVALLTPLTGFILQASRFDPGIVVVCLPLVLIHWAMMITFEFPDFEADRALGKKTLAVRLGRERAAWLHNALLIFAFALITGLALHWQAARFVWLALPLGVWQFAGVLWRARRGWSRLQLLTSSAVALLALTTVLWMMGFVIG